jgi:hypothetical protein
VTTLTVVSRAGWGARPPKCIATDTHRETFLHHTAGTGSGAAYMRAIQNFHIDRRGWCDFAYNWAIDPLTLVVYEGRGWGIRPGSQLSSNTATWSVVVFGNYNTAQPSVQLLQTIAAVIRWGHSLNRIPLLLTGGHKDAPGQATSCPGNHLYSQIPRIRSMLGGLTMLAVCRKGDTGPHVRALRTMLTAAGFPPEGGITDTYDQATSDALLALRKSLGSSASSGDFFDHYAYEQVHQAHIRRFAQSGSHSHDGRYLRDVTVVR